MQIPVLNGVYTDEASDFRVAYPRNLMPVPVSQGISNGYLRPAEGIVEETTGPGPSRAGINWNHTCYRVMAGELTRINSDGSVEELGSVGDDGGFATLDYSFDKLGVVSNGNFFLYDSENGLEQVTDPDLGIVFDFIWVDGYFMLTDGEFLIVTELGNPAQIDPLKYGSSEADPDPVKALLKLRNEPYALNRYTIEVFDNVGGTGFPFQRIDGAQIQRGTVGVHTCCVFLESVAFVGGGRNESISVWLAASGSSVRIATREVDQILAEYTEAELSKALVEGRVDKGHQHLYIHLPNKTLVYDAAASQVVGEPVWFVLTSSIGGGEYRARNTVWCYDKWLVGDTKSGRLGRLTYDDTAHWGEKIDWEFNTVVVYNEGRGAIFHELELVSLSGRAELGVDEFISTQYSLDGMTWSQEKPIRAGKQGQRRKRLVWINQGHMRHWRIQRFRGISNSKLSVARLEARVEPLGV